MSVIHNGVEVKICDYKDFNLKPGEFVLNDDCSKSTCGLLGKQFMVEIESCGVGHVNGCRLEPDFTRKYPG
jgi:hypothetical protein